VVKKTQILHRKKRKEKRNKMKEEPKQEIELIDGFIPTSFFDKQQTLEGALKNELEFVHNSCRNFDFDLGFKTGGLIGAEWQAERSYTQEDLKEAFKENYTPFSATNIGDLDMDFNKWFEKFKNK
jgi:hypothetical protein